MDVLHGNGNRPYSYCSGPIYAYSTLRQSTSRQKAQRSECDDPSRCRSCRLGIGRRHPLSVRHENRAPATKPGARSPESIERCVSRRHFLLVRHRSLSPTGASPSRAGNSSPFVSASHGLGLLRGCHHRRRWEPTVGPGRRIIGAYRHPVLGRPSPPCWSDRLPGPRRRPYAQNTVAPVRRNRCVDVGRDLEITGLHFDDARS